MKDGGSAFPGNKVLDSRGFTLEEAAKGMSLRDYSVVHLTAAWVIALGPRRGEDGYTDKGASVEAIRLAEIQADIIIAIQADTIIAKREEEEANGKD